MGTRKSQEILEHHRDSSKVLCHFIKKSLLTFLFSRKTQFQNKLILKYYSNGFFPKSMKNLKNFIFQPDEAPPHWHPNGQSFLNEITSTLDRWHRTPRLSTPLLTAKITRPYTLRLFLMAFYQKYGFCATISDSFR